VGFNGVQFLTSIDHVANGCTRLGWVGAGGPVDQANLVHDPVAKAKFYPYYIYDPVYVANVKPPTGITQYYFFDIKCVKETYYS
jgi:hypothetical protein